MHFKKYGGLLPVLCGTPYWAIPEKIQLAELKDMKLPRVLRKHVEFLGVLKKTIWKFQGSKKKEVEFKNKSCGISMGLVF